MLKKRFYKSKVKVTFEAPVELTRDAQSVHLAGDFNNWDEQNTPLEKKTDKKRGNVFSISLDLDLNREYQYRYLIDSSNWQNDWDAEKYVPNPFSGDNSVVSTYPTTEPAE